MKFAAANAISLACTAVLWTVVNRSRAIAYSDRPMTSTQKTTYSRLFPLLIALHRSAACMGAHMNFSREGHGEAARVHGERGARAYNGGKPPAGSRGRASGQCAMPPKTKSFEAFLHPKYGQNVAVITPRPSTCGTGSQ